MSKIDFLKPLSNFQYSINLEYDLYDDEKVKSYLPTTGALTIIEDILQSVMQKSETRSRLLTGAYGKGKSHLTLTLLAILSGRDKKLFRNVLDKVKETNPELYNNIILYLKSKKKLLPIIVNTASNDLKTNLLNSLSIALKQAGLSKLMPSTFFDVAIDTIINWEKNFPDTYKYFEKAVGYNGKEFVRELNAFNQDRYELFVETYPLLTSGSVFNPMQGNDVIRTYEAVLSALSDSGYNGVFIVYDEFGKFLEGSINSNTSARDIKLLQDLAERCSRSDIDKQMNLLLISHKGIDNYVGQLSKEKVDNWKAVADRFNKVLVQTKDSEIFEMIAQVLKKDESAFEDFVRRNTTSFAELDSILRLNVNTTDRIGARNGAFSEIVESIGRDFVENCYPLHPYTLLLLPKVSELVAQNERTIFTYLSANDKNTVSYFAKRNDSDFPIIEPDAIYDYFEPQFKAEPFGSPIREQWQITNAAIAKLGLVGNQLALKIVKTIGLIYILDQFEILPPSSDLIYEIYSLWGSIEIQKAFEILKHQELLIELEFKPFIKIRKSSNNNIKELINDEMAKLGIDFDQKKILVENMSSQYFYPVEYNDQLEITRYYKMIYIDYYQLLNIENIDKFIEPIEADGIIISVLLNDIEERAASVEKVNKLLGDRVIYVIPKDPQIITSYLQKYKAISNLIDKKASDILLIDELNYIKQDLFELINDYIEKQYLRPELKKTDYYYLGEKQKINRRVDVSKLMSKICHKVYADTPVVINENINRNKLSSTMKNTRSKVIAGILANRLKPKLGLQGSQDINVLRSIYVVPGIIVDEDNPIININGCEARFVNLFKRIKEYILSSSKESKKFIELYDLLLKPQYKLGLKKGIIPFYLSLIIREYKNHIVIYYKGKEVEINADLIISINENPDSYKLRLENWNDDKEQYIFRLKEIFKKYTRLNELELSFFDYVVKGMQRWYLHLSKFDRETKYYCDNVGNLLKCDAITNKIKNNLGYPEINSREFLFEKLPQIIGSEDFNVISDKVKEIKNAIDCNTSNYIKRINIFIRKLFCGNKNASLASVLADYYEGLKETTKNHIFSGNAAALIETIRTANNDENRLVKDFLKNIYSLRIDDFTDELAHSIEDNISKAKEYIDKYNAENNTFENACYTVLINDINGKTRKLQFEKMQEKTYQGQMFYNDITSTIEDFNESLSVEEKGQILLEILKEICR